LELLLPEHRISEPLTYLSNHSQLTTCSGTLSSDLRAAQLPKPSEDQAQLRIPLLPALSSPSLSSPHLPSKQ